MKNGIILTGHGQIASGIYSSIQMIAGNFDNLRVCDFKKGDSYDNLDKKLIKAYQELSTYENIIILADIGGGSPFNRAVLSLASYKNVYFLTGMNFEMVYQALNFDCEDIEKKKKKIIDTAQKSIYLFD